MAIKTVLSNLYATQQKLNQAETSREVAKALRDVVSNAVAGSTVEIMLGSQSPTGEFASLALDALKEHQPRLGLKGNHLAAPLVVASQVFGLMSVEGQRPFSELEQAFILAQAQLAAIQLERLSWPASPEVFRGLVENANVAIDVAEPTGMITYANRAAAELYGYSTPGELIGKNVSDQYPPGDEEIIRTALADGRPPEAGWAGEVRVYDRNRRIFPIELALFGVHDSRYRSPSFGAILQDVSEYHRLFDALEEKTRGLESVNRVGALLSTSLDRKRVLSLASEQLVLLMNVDHCSIVIIDETGESAHVEAEYPRTVLADTIISLHDNPLLDVDAPDDVFISSDVAHDARLESRWDALVARGVKSIMTVRLEAKGQIIGNIGLDCIEDYR